MPAQLVARLALVKAQDLGIQLANGIGEFLSRCFEHPQPRGGLVDDPQQHGPSSRRVGRREPCADPPIKFAFMRLEPIFVNLAPQLLEGIRIFWLDGMAREEHESDFARAGCINRLSAQQAYAFKLLVRLPAQPRVEQIAQLAPEFQKDLAAGEGCFQLRNQPGRMIGVIGNVVPRRPRLLVVIVSRRIKLRRPTSVKEQPLPERHRFQFRAKRFGRRFRHFIAAQSSDFSFIRPVELPRSHRRRLGQLILERSSSLQARFKRNQPSPEMPQGLPPATRRSSP